MNKNFQLAMKIGKVALTAYATVKAVKAFAGALLELRNRRGITIKDTLTDDWEDDE